MRLAPARAVAAAASAAAGAAATAAAAAAAVATATKHTPRLAGTRDPASSTDCRKARRRRRAFFVLERLRLRRARTHAKASPGLTAGPIRLGRPGSGGR